MKVNFTIKWQTLTDDTEDFEDYFGISYEEFSKLPKEQQEQMEQSVIDQFRENIVLQVSSIKYNSK
jgi:hypothetical protein